MKMNKYDYDFISLNKDIIKQYFPWWYNYLVEKFDLIQEYIKNNWLNIKLSYKEKYWRFDITPREWADDWIMEHVYEIENRTPYICIDCWEALDEIYWWEDRRDLWWVLPRCEKCFQIKLSEREEMIRQRDLKLSESNTTTESESK